MHDQVHKFGLLWPTSSLFAVTACAEIMAGLWIFELLDFRWI